jgi:hypothetical protein
MEETPKQPRTRASQPRAPTRSRTGAGGAVVGSDGGGAASGPFSSCRCRLHLNLSVCDIHSNPRLHIFLFLQAAPHTSPSGRSHAPRLRCPHQWRSLVLGSHFKSTFYPLLLPLVCTHIVRVLGWAVCDWGAIQTGPEELLAAVLQHLGVLDPHTLQISVRAPA